MAKQIHVWPFAKKVAVRDSITSKGWEGMYELQKKDGGTVNAGEKLKDFRGDTEKLEGGQAPQGQGKEGYVYVTGNQRYYAGVFGLKWVLINKAKDAKMFSAAAINAVFQKAEKLTIESSFLEINNVSSDLSAIINWGKIEGYDEALIQKAKSLAAENRKLWEMKGKAKDSSSEELKKLRAELAGTNDTTNHLGEKEYRTYNGWKVACKAANPSVRFEGDKEICNALPGVGEWDGEKGSVYAKTKDALSRADIDGCNRLIHLLNQSSVPVLRTGSGNEIREAIDDTNAVGRLVQDVIRNLESAHIKTKDAMPREDTARLPDGRYDNRELGEQGMISWTPRVGQDIDYFDRQGTKRYGKVTEVSGGYVTIKPIGSDGYASGVAVKQQIVPAKGPAVAKDANPDGTISPDEEKRTRDLLSKAARYKNELRTEAYEIGGSFRGPGIWQQIVSVLRSS